MTDLCAICGASIIYVISEAGADTWGSQSEWQHVDSLIDLGHYPEIATVALRATIRDEVTDAYQIPAELRDAWDAIKEGDDD